MAQNPVKEVARRAAVAVGAVVLALVVLSVVGVARWHPSGHGPAVAVAAAASTSRSTNASGTDERTRLRVLLADAPDLFVLDLDRETVQAITGLPKGRDRGLGIEPVGRDALVFSYRICARCRLDPALFVVRHGKTAATRLARTPEAVPSLDGEGFWILARQRGRRCEVREVGLDGRARRAGRQVPCGMGLVAELPAGLLMRYSGRSGATHTSRSSSRAAASGDSRISRPSRSSGISS